MSQMRSLKGSPRSARGTLRGPVSPMLPKSTGLRPLDMVKKMCTSSESLCGEPALGPLKSRSEMGTSVPGPEEMVRQMSIPLESLLGGPVLGPLQPNNKKKNNPYRRHRTSTLAANKAIVNMPSSPSRASTDDIACGNKLETDLLHRNASLDRWEVEIAEREVTVAGKPLTQATLPLPNPRKRAAGATPDQESARYKIPRLGQSSESSGARVCVSAPDLSLSRDCSSKALSSKETYQRLFSLKPPRSKRASKGVVSGSIVKRSDSARRNAGGSGGSSLDRCQKDRGCASPRALKQRRNGVDDRCRGQSRSVAPSFKEAVSPPAVKRLSPGEMAKVQSKLESTFLKLKQRSIDLLEEKSHDAYEKTIRAAMCKGFECGLARETELRACEKELRRLSPQGRAARRKEIIDHYRNLAKTFAPTCISDLERIGRKSGTHFFRRGISKAYMRMFLMQRLWEPEQRAQEADLVEVLRSACEKRKLRSNSTSQNVEEEISTQNLKSLAEMIGDYRNMMLIFEGAVTDMGEGCAEAGTEGYMRC